MGKRAVEADELVCPVCGASYPRGERFCATCKLPLVYSGDGSSEMGPVSASHERARKVKPQFGQKGERPNVVTNPTDKAGTGTPD